MTNVKCAKMRNVNGKKTFTFDYTCEQAVKIFDFLYSNCNRFLLRKKVRAEKLTNKK
ncbi:MAG: hypothetical protein GTO02_10160 [Candidatus Dadabacteria bacterium]|nr:hypothetical protein [Candidatus Dadabacteria bacterium]